MNTVKQEYRDCCGCSACLFVCPTNAIEMQEDEKGFLYPVKGNSCTNCGLCEKICQFNANYQRTTTTTPETIAYAAINKDAVRRAKSRSGGTFRAFAEYIIEKEGGVVYGAAFNENNVTRYVRINSLDEINAVCGSKYVQSRTDNCFTEIESDLGKSKTVLLGGTPCMVSGLNGYLKYKNVDTRRLYVCDIVCHGVPSPLVFRDNLKRLSDKYDGKIKDISFRDKKFGWKSHIESYVIDGKRRFGFCYTDLFYKHLIIRESCSNCHFCNLDRCGDITLGDCWGVDKVAPQFNDNKGTSLLLINSENGNKLLKEVNDQLDIKCVDINNCMQPNLIKASVLSERYNEFWNDYGNRGFAYVCRVYCDKWIFLLKIIYNYLFNYIRNKQL